eukprot:1884022-Rhodomonas_salina.2
MQQSSSSAAAQELTQRLHEIPDLDPRPESPSSRDDALDVCVWRVIVSLHAPAMPPMRLVLLAPYLLDLLGRIGPATRGWWCDAGTRSGSAGANLGMLTACRADLRVPRVVLGRKSRANSTTHSGSFRTQRDRARGAVQGRVPP